MKLIPAILLLILGAFVLAPQYGQPVYAAEKCNITSGIETCDEELLIPTICSGIASCVTAFVNIIFIIAALLMFVYMIWGGIDYITAGGDEGQVGTARAKVTNAVIGLVIVISAWAIAVFTLRFFLGPDQSPEDIIPVIPQGGSTTTPPDGRGTGGP